MDNKKQYRKAKKMQTMMKILSRLKRRPKTCRERFIKTSQGDIRVLEYGFKNENTTPLLIDMHGGGFVLTAPESDDGMNQHILKARQIMFYFLRSRHTEYYRKSIRFSLLG